MVCETDYGFFGGYDHQARGGFVHVANPHISPGKKQWTWGNHEFGWAWDRELTDANGPYVELMAGVYTDNQPDFSYLAPYETKTFSQFWWPYQQIGPVKNATTDAAVSLEQKNDRGFVVGLAVTESVQAELVIRKNDDIVFGGTITLSPTRPWSEFFAEPISDSDRLDVNLLDASGRRLVGYTQSQPGEQVRHRQIAEAPPEPDAAQTNESLYLIGEHLEQYRHPTRCPETYWQTALERDEDDSRCNIALGQREFRRGRLHEATMHFQRAIARLTSMHPNPRVGEAHYGLGLTFQFMGQLDQAYSALYKSAWNYEWRSAACFQLALIDCRRQDYRLAIQHCDQSLETNTQNNKAYVLRSLAQQKLGLNAGQALSQLLERDPLDHWATLVVGDTERFLRTTRNDAQSILDVAYDFIDGGFYVEAVDLLELHDGHDVPAAAVPNPLSRSQLTSYLLAFALMKLDRPEESEAALNAAREADPDYFFPSRLHDQLILEWALEREPADFNAAFGLGNYFYNVKRHDDAIALWESVKPASKAKNNATIYRNLGIAYWNTRRDARLARDCYDKALEMAPSDARIFYEADQLAKKIGDANDRRWIRRLHHFDCRNQNHRIDCGPREKSLFRTDGHHTLNLSRSAVRWCNHPALNQHRRREHSVPPVGGPRQTGKPPETERCSRLQATTASDLLLIRAASGVSHKVE